MRDQTRVTHLVEKHGPFMYGEYEELGDRVQSWVLAGVKGAVEIRGTRASQLYILVHSPVRRWLYGLHSQHQLVDIDVLHAECQILDGHCSVFLLEPEAAVPMLTGRDGIILSDLRADLVSIYECYLNQDGS